MTHGKPATTGERLKHELRVYAVLVLYLYICFGALLLYKAAVMNEAGIGILPVGLALVKALVLGKFILLGHAMRLGDRREDASVALAIIRKSLLFAALLIILTMVEEAVVALVHGEAVVASLADKLGSKLPETLASCLVMLLVLIPYIAFLEIDKALGGGTLGKLLFRRSGPEIKS